MAFILGSLLFGGVAALLAHYRARNALCWFVTGCFLGPFALVVALLPMGIRDGITKECPNCAEAIRANARICRFCNSGLRQEPGF